MHGQNATRRQDESWQLQRAILVCTAGLNVIAIMTLGSGIPITRLNGLVVVGAGGAGVLLSKRPQLAVNLWSVGGFASIFLWLPVDIRSWGVLSAMASFGIMVGSQAGMCLPVVARARRKEVEITLWERRLKVGLAIEAATLLFVLLVCWR